MFSVALGEQRHNMPGKETLPDCFRIVSTVAYEVIRTMARAAFPARAGLLQQVRVLAASRYGLLQ